MTVVYRVYRVSYEGDWTIGVFSDRDAAVTFARKKARTISEAFTGSVGDGVCIEVLDSENGTAVPLGEWRDWTVKMVGARFVVDEDLSVAASGGAATPAPLSTPFGGTTPGANRDDAEAAT